MSGLPVTVRTFPMGSKAEVRLGVSKVRGPTRKGVSLPVEALPDLVAAVVEAEVEARALGLLEKGGAKTE